MTMDTYGMNDAIARCANCAKFMPWSRSVLVEKSDGLPSPSPVYIESGICERCDHTAEHGD